MAISLIVRTKETGPMLLAGKNPWSQTSTGAVAPNPAPSSKRPSRRTGALRAGSEVFPVRGSRCFDLWDDEDDAAQVRAELEERERQLEASVARTRRRLPAERRKQERRRRGRA